MTTKRLSYLTESDMLESCKHKFCPIIGKTCLLADCQMWNTTTVKGLARKELRWWGHCGLNTMATYDRNPLENEKVKKSTKVNLVLLRKSDSLIKEEV